MKNLLVRNLALSVAACLLPSLAVHAEPWAFLNSTIVARIPAKDLPAFKSEIAKTLNETPDKGTSYWESHNGRNGQPVKIVFKPMQTVQTSSAGTCRLLTAEVSQLSIIENWQFWFCQQANGAWKSSGSHLP